MLLQVDPTVIYGLGKSYMGKLHHTDLFVPTPFNTYLNHGLPPTPIAFAGADAIYAAMHPATSDYLYYVAKGNGIGHQFSRTLAEHKAAVLSAFSQKPSTFSNTILLKHYVNKALANPQP